MPSFLTETLWSCYIFATSLFSSWWIDTRFLWFMRAWVWRAFAMLFFCLRARTLSNSDSALKFPKPWRPVAWISFCFLSIISIYSLMLLAFPQLALRGWMSPFSTIPAISLFKAVPLRVASALEVIVLSAPYLLTRPMKAGWWGPEN